MRIYPWANLPKFEVGVSSHVESIKASILLYNYNLELLVKEFGPEVFTKWREPEHYLAAAYNGGVGCVIRALKWTRVRNAGPKQWRRRLDRIAKTNETYYFLEKLDVAQKYY